MTVLLPLVLSCLVVTLSEGARILAVFPVPSISHQVVFRPLTRELARRGHDVVVITPDPVHYEPKVQNLTEIDVHDISYNIWVETFMKASKGQSNAQRDQIGFILELLTNVFDAQLNDKQVKTLLVDKSQKFDLILSEALVRPSIVFSHIYNAPVIQVSSFGASIDNYAVIGAPMHPILYPAATRQRLHNLTLWEKVTEVYNDYMLQKVFDTSYELANSVLKSHFGNNLPSMDKLNNNVAMLFLNVHPIFEGIRPVPPTVLYMGGLHQKPNKELPSDLKSYLDSSKFGVIYLSFGTNVDPSLLPPVIIQALVNAFSTLKYDVLWKWNKDELPGRSSNIKISKWLPQSDLLKHPNVKLFITQGGLQSTDEAITAGVPLIGIPMLGDQWFNVEKYKYHKIGVRIDMEALNEESLTQAIHTILGDESYRSNIKQLGKYMRDEPMPPLDRAMWWTEYVIRHRGAKQLRAPAANMKWREYLELDLVLILLALMLTTVFITITILRVLYVLVIRNVKIKVA